MHAVNLSKRLSVEVFDHNRPIDESAWIEIGNYEDLAHAVDACRKVIDRVLYKPRYASLTGHALMQEYLNYGPVPCIRGVDNMDAFDPYEYLESKAKLGCQKHHENALGFGL
ncbi:hypothetical protein [Polynucleobacter ibericus]|uniref:hypothetical protein n=1 Tax=Polynucleobacter ibericus TaxID=1819725 RepID=UPI001BFD9D29|nr:hypothetical protein [Polynucleobacter ibericus]QWE07908.1 hypothetical protein AOC20_05555 [Polynucleobacter ibericus]